jgi:hypothetical protein
MKFLVTLTLVSSLGLVTLTALANEPSDNSATSATTAPPSSTAQRLYSQAQKDLLQIRVLVKNGRSQASVGSGFFLGDSDLVATNYHVVSQIALEPDTYVGEYLDTEGQRGSVELLAVDVLRDLAIVRVDRQGSGFFKLPEPGDKLAQGQYLYSLGNPLDLGFAISEGTYNGVVQRDFSDLLMFTGALNPGMSGGPNITASGRIAGVNVSHRRDGELVSFLVPARYLRNLVDALTDTTPEDFNPVIAAQLLEHQAVMIDRLLETPLSLRNLGNYQVPVRESEQLRCWGSADTRGRQGYTSDRIQCAMESQIFISNELQTGHISINHSLLRRTELDSWRFARIARDSFSNQIFRSKHNTRVSGPECSEAFLDQNNLRLRSVLCFAAYNKFEGLYNLSLLSVSVDDADTSLQSRLNVSGISFDNGLRLARAYLQAMARDAEADVGADIEESQP